MRFIREERIITTICNEVVSDKETIVSLLNNLKKSRIEFSLIIKKFFGANTGYRRIEYNKVRVDKVKEELADFLVLDKKCITHVKNIPFSEILEISAITTIDKILKVEPDITKWELLDIESSEGIDDA